ncbi:polysaccharide biosynthesis tyrosine autokinase [Amycolatopsis cynarae]|uniref:Polysaccharide biosynthesis tyrosine autokinase n=1 Tax=Amycolatopsis cynarae TaxID=2995223 RepID=A0ABY7AWP7_9PSEU|nr:polysaccharide biosynthesis tyrosine autokinase [Amycolatopsis sp. HUAS 11-8]WAL63918.1 polysaccharide biosynthesis tyrosine autokinase [Amycolatopsis sp. HUAS 11-8]
MSLYYCRRVARKRWRIIFFGLLLGVAAAATVTRVVAPEYSAQATLYLSSPGETDGSAGSVGGERLRNSFAWLAGGQHLAQAVVDQLGLHEPASAVSAKLQSSSRPGTSLVSITATDATPQGAKTLADAAAGALTRLVTQLQTSPPVTASVIEPAAVPTRATQPRPLLDFGLGVLLGLLAGALAALVREALDRRITEAGELTRLTGAPNLATVPHDPAAPEPPSFAGPGRTGPAESFRTLRTALSLVDVDRPRKAILVTGALPGSGRTTTLCGLAVALGRTGRRVVLVETDLRHPHALDHLGVGGGEVGLTSVLTGQVALEQALRTWSGSAVFDVLPAGPLPPDPARLLASRRMADLLAELRRRYDTVLLDAPEVPAGADAAVLGAACDGGLLVVAHGRTTRHQVKTALLALAAGRVRLFGTVLTMAPLPPGQTPVRIPEQAPEPSVGRITGTVPLDVIASAPKSRTHS